MCQGNNLGFITADIFTLPTGKYPAISMETTQHFEEHDEITADVTTEHDFLTDGAAE